MSAQPLTDRGITECRGCGRPELVSVLDLGEQPLANDYPADPAESIETFPLHLRICRACGLGQLGEFVLPERIFRDYAYLSSVSSSWNDHARRFALSMVDAMRLTRDDLVLEIASNDGYLLRHFAACGVPVLGVEPAHNIAERASSDGVPTISEFFGSAIADRLASERGHPRLIVANNVYAHVPDLDDFTRGLAMLCDDATVVTIENPSFATLMLEAQFDTIYHEHFSYLSAHSVRAAANRHDLDLVRVDRLPTHGGSNRYWLRRRGITPPAASVSAALAEEQTAGLLDPERWAEFAAASRSAVDGLQTWLAECGRDGRRVAAYGAAAKGNTLLNAAGVRFPALLGVADGSVEKQGRFLPGSRVPIVPPEGLAALDATDVLILPWNLSAEIGGWLAAELPQVSRWVAIPELREVG